MSAIQRKNGTKHKNSKTVISFDTTTICPRVRAGRPCAYCYVQNTRNNGGYRAKSLIEHETYSGWVSTLTQDKKDLLNSMGGIRMFSFGDYMPAHRQDVQRFLDDCEANKVYAKAITKVPLFIPHFHDHPALTTIHVSIDNLKKQGSNVTHARAQQLREKYDKVAVRAVCVSREDVEWALAQPWVDILTLNHVMAKGMRYFTRVEKTTLARQYPRRVCCANHNCTDCKVKCLVSRGKLKRRQE